MRSLSRRLTLAALGLLAAAIVAVAIALEWRFQAGKEEVDRLWARSVVTRLHDVGSTRTLEILPLVDWATASPDLEGEAGVAYLIRTDHHTVLFDVGLNGDQRSPSPLLANMKRLGVTLDDIDTVILSHDHIDHVGGLQWSKRGSFSLGNEQPDLSGKRIFVPVDMTYPGASPVVSRLPTVIGPGIATTGTIARQLYMGRVDEQALAIRVEGKGIVLIVGCGHQGMSRLLARSAALFDAPLYGLIGGLHYPVPHGRLRTAGIDLQPLVAFGPFRTPSLADVASDIELLDARQPHWVSLSAHDSSDESMAAFKRAFGARYREMKVGEWLKLADGEERQVSHAVNEQ